MICSKVTPNGWNWSMIAWFGIHVIRVALFSKIIFKMVVLHNIKRRLHKTPKIMNFPKKKKSKWRLLILCFSGLAQFSVLTYFHYYGFFGILSMRENSVILKISPFGHTLLSKYCSIWSFYNFGPMHNFYYDWYEKFNFFWQF